MNNHWLTLLLFLVAVAVGATIPPVVLGGHDLTVWRVGLAVVAGLVAGVVLAVIYLAVEKAREG
jgi:ABC-type microcin C transport system permease subunit YejB